MIDATNQPLWVQLVLIVVPLLLSSQTTHWALTTTGNTTILYFTVSIVLIYISVVTLHAVLTQRVDNGGDA